MWAGWVYSLPGQGKNQTDRIGVVVTAGKADHLRIRLIVDHFVSDELRTLDRVDHENQIADALSTVGSKPALLCWCRKFHSTSKNPKYFRALW